MSKTENSIARTALIVLGMHRSGTSALAGVLAKLGVEAPRTLMPPTQDNPKGYWESSALMRFNDAILASAGTRWDDWEAFNETWRDTPTGKSVLSELPALLEQEFGAAPLFLVKDPRICRLLPAWLQGLSGLGIAAKIVVPLRHPAEVAQSLGARDGITPLQARLIWLRHVLDAERASRGQDRVFVRYSDLLADWRNETARIARVLEIAWPRRSGTVEAEIDAYLTTELRRQVAEPKQATGTPVMAWVAEAYSAFDDLADGLDEDTAQRRLDAVRRAFDASADAFAPLFQEVRTDLQRRLDERSEAVVQADAELEDLRGKNGLLKQECVANYDLAMKYKSALEDMREQFHGREAAFASLEARYQSGQDELGRMRDAGGAVSKDLEATKAELASRIASLQDREAALAALEARYQSAQDELGHMREANSAASRAVEAAKAELASSAASFQGRIDGLQRGHAESEDRFKQEIAELSTRLHAQIRMLSDEKRAADEAAQERTSEIVSLTRRVIELEGRLSTRDATISSLQADIGRRSARELEQSRRIEVQKRKLGEQDVRAEVLFSEIDALSRIVSGYRQKLSDIRSSRRLTFPSTLRRMAADIIRVPTSERTEKADEALLRKSGLFDGSWYLTRYPDVHKRKMDPVRHYLRYGAKEGRDPGPAFSTSGYGARHPDVAGAGINPLVHYLVYGRSEGRSIAGIGSEKRKEELKNAGEN